MLIDPDSIRVLIYNIPVDMRRAIDGLSATVAEQLRESPASGTLYVFYNHRKDKLKVLYWERNGFCLFYKRLEKGRFKLPAPGDKTMAISKQQLRWLLDGLDISKIKGHASLSYDIFH
jgi:transposase